MKRIQIQNQTSIYHCISRSVHGERWMDEHGRSVFCKILNRLSGFCGIRVLTYCVMSNHFHLLLEVPPKDEREHIPDQELLRRYRLLYGEDGTDFMPLSAEAMSAIFEENGALARHWRKCLKERMHDLPLFMKLLKHRFTKWYNTTHQTFGTFWAERYTSLLLEPKGELLRKVGCYIDLNPVRAGIVNDPADYLWSGYGASRMGDEGQCELLARLSAYNDNTVRTPFATYEQELYWRGAHGINAKDGGKIPAHIADKIRLKNVAISRESPLDSEMTKIIRCGLIYGSQKFVKTYAKTIQMLLGRKKIATRPAESDCETWYWGKQRRDPT